MYPDADIPVVQLSVQLRLGTAHHLAMGHALQPLRDEGTLIVASGSSTHNLRDFFGRSLDAEPLSYARDFNEWLKDAISNDNIPELLDYINKGPQAQRNHPTPEHFLPLFVAMGSGGKGQTLHDSFAYGAIAMSAFAWC
jgi:4,5-DOPA dioxygenase extradiol